MHFIIITREWTLREYSIRSARDYWTVMLLLVSRLPKLEVVVVVVVRCCVEEGWMALTVIIAVHCIHP